MKEPLLDLFDDRDRWVLEIALPGVLESDIDVTLLGNRVIIRAERPEPPRAYLLHELHRGLLERALELPSSVELVEASFEEGLLRLHLRKV